MKRETKVGLLVGMGVILLIGIILSDHLSVVQQQHPAGQMSNFAPTADREISGNGIAADPGSIADSNQSAPLPQPARQIVPVPEPGEDIKPAPAPTTPTDPTTAKVANAGGGTVTPQPPAEPPTAVVADKAPAKPLAIHIVKHGDTLYKLAFSAYGNGSKWDLIQKANPDIGPQGQLHEGQKLVIPADGVPEEIKKSGMFEPANPATTPGASDVPVKSAAGAAGGYNIVQVEEGETLATIAKEHLGSSQRWKEILDLNKNQLKRPQDLQVGMKLRLPATTSTKTAAATDDTDATSTVSPAVTPGHTTTATATKAVTKIAPPTPNVTTARTYTVQPGDSLASIAAKKLGSRAKWEQLFQANRKLLASPADLKIGQVLILPAVPGR